MSSLSHFMQNKKNKAKPFGAKLLKLHDNGKMIMAR
jgi:hypothetical protein